MRKEVKPPSQHANGKTVIEFFHIKRDIPFMSYGKLTTAISLGTFLAAVFFLAIYGLNLGVEFTGGTVLEIHYDQPVDIQHVRQVMKTLRRSDIHVQALGSSRDLMVRLPNVETVSTEQWSKTVLAELQKTWPAVTIQKTEFIGPSIGNELLVHGGFALLLVCIGIIFYLALRFEWRFAISAVLANSHDVVIILGCFALFQWEFNLTVLAGVLAVLGYSVNESVVVFDRIRENFRSPKMRDKSIPHIIDNAITATVSRTIITHGSTQAMVLSMLFLGGSALLGFATALTIGILFGIYSSVFVASPLLLMLGLTRKNMITPKRTKEEVVV